MTDTNLKTNNFYSHSSLFDQRAAQSFNKALDCKLTDERPGSKVLTLFVKPCLWVWRVWSLRKVGDGTGWIFISSTLKLITDGCWLYCFKVSLGAATSKHFLNQLPGCLQGFTSLLLTKLQTQVESLLVNWWTGPSIIQRVWILSSEEYGNNALCCSQGDVTFTIMINLWSRHSSNFHW